MIRAGRMIAGAVAAMAAAASAQNNVAVVDIARIFEQYERTSYLEEEFLAKKKFLGDEAEKRRKQLDTSRQALNAYQPDTPDYRQKVAEIREAEIRFEVWSRQEDEELKNAHKLSLLQIYADVREAVRKVAEQRGLDLVVTYDLLTEGAPDSVALRQQILLQKVIYWNPGIDLTDAVLQMLNEQFQRSQPGSARPAGDAAKSAPPKDPPKPPGQSPPAKPEPKKQ